MSDLIDRQEAVEAIASHDPSNGDVLYFSGKMIIGHINDLPSIQPTQLTDEDKETIRIHLSDFKEWLCNQSRCHEAKECDELISRLFSTPSVQPEIIRCKDCKHYMQTDTIHHRGWCWRWNHFTAIERYCSERALRGDSDDD